MAEIHFKPSRPITNLARERKTGIFSGPGKVYDQVLKQSHESGAIGKKRNTVLEEDDLVFVFDRFCYEKFGINVCDGGFFCVFLVFWFFF